LWNLENNDRFDQVITVCIVDQLTEDDMRTDQSGQRGDREADHTVPGGTRFHDRKECAYTFVLEEAQTDHCDEILVVEQLPVRSWLIIVLVDSDSAPGSDQNDHQVYDDNRVDITVLEDFERSHPGNRREDDQSEAGKYPYVDVYLCTIVGLGVALFDDSLASASEEAQHCKTVAEVQ
jgi:hypothetical protein